MRVIERIEKIRALRGLTQEELERAAALPRNRIPKWVGGRGVPSGPQSLRLARTLGVPVEWLVDESAPEEPPRQEPGLSESDWLVLDVARKIGHAEVIAILTRTGGSSLTQSPIVEASRGNEELANQLAAKAKDALQRKTSRRKRGSA